MSLPRTLFLGRGATPVTWYRCALPAMALGCEWAGAVGNPPELIFVTGVTERPITFERLFEYDVIVLQQPRGAAWLRTIRRLQDAGVRVLFEVDDYLHGVRRVAGHQSQHVFRRDALRELELCLRVCDGVICSTPYIASRYRSFNSEVDVCLNGLDLARYALTRTPREDETWIGWAGGTGHRDAVRAWLPEVAAVLREYPETRFVSIGHPFADELRGEVEAHRLLTVPFTLIDSYPAALTIMDVAIAPAGSGSFFRGKSDLRFLEAGALEVPVVADPTVYRMVEPGVTGLVASTPAEAGEALRTLVTDAALRDRLGSAARSYVERERDIRVMAGQWAAVLGRTRGLRHAA
jgi:glycosyltransferase involved in cell wall biosynthesis